MTPEEREDILDRLRDYLKASRELTAQTAEGREEVDQGTLPLVIGLTKLYEDRSWVGELEPVKRRQGRGRREKPDSFERFVKWLREKVEISTSLSTFHRFFQAQEALNYFPQGESIRTTEGALRPLVHFALGKHSQGSSADLPDLCRRAEDSRHGPGTCGSTA